MVIETERLILRPFTVDDAEDVFEYLNKPTLNCFQSMKLNSLDEAKEELKKRSEDTEYYFAVTLKENGKVIGELEASPQKDEPRRKDSPMCLFGLAWMINPKYQKKGYAYEGAKAFLDYLFNEKGARRIYAYTEDYNLPCQGLCEKLGMRKEALFKEFVNFVNEPDGTPIYENTYQYAILKKEWK